jgi:hypothetical protein
MSLHAVQSVSSHVLHQLEASRHPKRALQVMML